MFAVPSLRVLLLHFIIKHNVPLTILVLNGHSFKAENTSHACSGATTIKPLAAWQALLLWSFKPFVK